MSFFWDPTPTLLTTDLRYPPKFCHALTPGNNSTRCGRPPTPEVSEMIDSIVIAMSQHPPDQVPDPDLALLARLCLCPSHRFEERALEMNLHFRLANVLRGYYQYQGLWQDHWTTLSHLRTRLGITGINYTAEHICRTLDDKLLQMGAMRTTIDSLMREALARENIMLKAQAEILRLQHCLSELESGSKETQSEPSIANEEDDANFGGAEDVGQTHDPTRRTRSFWGEEDGSQISQEQFQEMADCRRTRTSID